MTARVPEGRMWDALPAPLRTRLAEVAATAVGALPVHDLPAVLRPLARFTPRKRARVGGAALLGELAGSVTFRAAVLAWWLEHRGESDPDPDPLDVAAEAVLADRADAPRRVAEIADRADASALRGARDAALARVDKLTAEVERLRGELTEARRVAGAVDGERDREIRRLRSRLSEQGERLRRETDDARRARDELAELRRSTDQRLSLAEAARDRERTRASAERARAARASEAATDAREVAERARRTDRARVELLVETLSGVVDGLRRELSLGGGAGPRPADLVIGASVRDPYGPAVDDETGLERLLGLPSVHLVVDGYNVSKAGYPELSLFDQRARLVGQLGVLAARTGAEVTCVFDGAAVAAGPGRRPRGVRVLFSDPGVAADDVILALVAAEPAGRPVVVVTSDRAVVDAVRRDGAPAVPSAVLLRRLARG